MNVGRGVISGCRRYVDTANVLVQMGRASEIPPTFIKPTSMGKATKALSNGSHLYVCLNSAALETRRQRLQALIDNAPLLQGLPKPPRMDSLRELLRQALQSGRKITSATITYEDGTVMSISRPAPT
jgi:predicted peroxiredoxin